MLLESSKVPDICSSKIPLLKQTASCGPGQDWGDADMIEDYIEPLALVPSLRGAKVYAFRVRGSSMIGVGIYDGDIVLFDGRENVDPTDDLYVFALDGAVYCKWLKFDPISHRIQIYSVHSPELEKAELLRVIDTDNPDQITAFHVFGRILAWVRENRMVYR
jgi:phage repressor protein C with HTH and peptisase S24 domain